MPPDDLNQKPTLQIHVCGRKSSNSIGKTYQFGSATCLLWWVRNAEVKMNSQKLGLAIFLAGALYLFVGGWLVNWWVVPMYKFTAPEQISQTVWAPGSPLFYLWAFAPIGGALLVAIGMLLRTEPKNTWMAAIASALIILSAMFPETMGYSVTGFGLLGLMITLLFIAIVWYWGKNRVTLVGPAKTAADFQLIGYIFFFMASISVCALLGYPIHTNPGLYFPEKVIDAGSLPKMYALGIKIGAYLVLGFFFNFLAVYKRSTAMESLSGSGKTMFSSEAISTGGAQRLSQTKTAATASDMRIGSG
jgi:hypothetical protein